MPGTGIADGGSRLRDVEASAFPSREMSISFAIAFSVKSSRDAKISSDTVYCGTTWTRDEAYLSPSYDTARGELIRRSSAGPRCGERGANLAERTAGSDRAEPFVREFWEIA